MPKIPPNEQAAYTNNGENENTMPFGLGRRSGYLEANRVANGGISDDPTDDGAPVIDSKPFKLKKV